MTHFQTWHDVYQNVCVCLYDFCLHKWNDKKLQWRNKKIDTKYLVLPRETVMEVNDDDKDDNHHLHLPS